MDRKVRKDDMKRAAIKCDACGLVEKLIASRLTDVENYQCRCGHWVKIPWQLREE